MRRRNTIEEARRYVANAQDIIKNADYDAETRLYNDEKYVRIAGHTLWSGCLIALRTILNFQGKGRPSIERYREAAGRRDRKLLKYLNAGYDVLHLYMGYDGVCVKKACDSGFDIANDIIDRCETLQPGKADA